METLEGVKSQVEVVEPTPKEEAEPTPLKVEPTVKIQDTKEFRAELDKAVGKGLSTINKQLSTQKTEAEKASKMVKTAEAERQAIQTELDRLTELQFAEDPEARKAFLDRKTITDGQRQLAKA